MHESLPWMDSEPRAKPDRRPLVLVVNDDAAMRHALQFVLQLEGIEVRLHAEMAELAADPRLPLADCLIVQDGDGVTDVFEFLHARRRIPAFAPVILLTHDASQRLRAKARAAGIRLILEKPLLDDALVENVLAILKNRREGVADS